MTPAFFELPFVVFGSAPTSFKIIATVADAADFLFDHWAGHDSESWTYAMTVCDAAEMGETNISEARRAFIKAVQAVGMQVDRRIVLH